MSTTVAKSPERPKVARATMPALQVNLSKLVIAVLLALCIGAQLVEATGRWDRTLQDTSDEAVVVAVVLCIGAGFAMARVMRERLSLPSGRSSTTTIVHTTLRPVVVLRLPSRACESPPQSLRI